MPIENPAKSDSAAPDWPQITGYALETAIGRGGMGRVFRARDLELGRTVAIKFLLHTGDLQLWARFAGEARAVAQLQHPNIARLYEFHADPHQPYLVMEYIGGGTLADYVGGRPISAKLASQIISTLARAIDSAHRRGIVHRDLKPSNILIVEQTGSTSAPRSDDQQENEAHNSTLPFGRASPTLVGDSQPDTQQTKRAALTRKSEPEPDSQLDVANLRIADFGLAKHISADTKHTRTGEVVGTPDYMSPEQATGVMARVGPSTDIYALGAIFYKLLTGRPPFVGADTVDTILMLLSDEPIPPRTLIPRMPTDVQTICLKCLDKNPARRYASAAELADDLERFNRGEPIKARPVSLPEKILKWIRRKPWQAAALGLLLVSIVGAVIGVILLTSTNAKLTKSNSDLSIAIQEADQAFQLSQESLGRIVDRVRNDLYEVPQAEKLTRETAQDSADLHRRLHALRPEDVKTLHQLVSSLDIHRLTEWTYGDREKSQKVTEELVKLVDASCQQRPDDVVLATKQASLWMELADKLDPGSDATRRDELEHKIKSRLEHLLKTHPNDPQVCKTASVQSQRLVNDAVGKGDLNLVIKYTQERVEFSRRFARNSSQIERHSALQWLIQGLVTLAEFQMAARDVAKANALLDESEETLQQGLQIAGTNRGDRNFAAHIRAIRGKLAMLENDLQSAIEHFRAAEETYKQLLHDFPDDVSLTMPLAGNHVDLAVAFIADRRQPEAMSRLQEAESLADAVLMKIPDDYLANSIKQRVATLRATLVSGDDSALETPAPTQND